MSKVPREYECPVCEGHGSLCSHDGADGEHCPKGYDSCDEDSDCGHISACSYCKGEGMVTFSKMERHARKTSKIKWGEPKKAGASP
jgi:hypothetical protein